MYVFNQSFLFVTFLFPGQNEMYSMSNRLDLCLCSGFCAATLNLPEVFSTSEIEKCKGLELFKGVLQHL